MCLSIPMRLVVLEGRNGDFAVAERGQGDALRRERVNLMLIGPQPVGTWVLASLDLAREVLEDGERELIEDALAAVSAALTGDYDPARHFADLTGKPGDPGEPQ